MEKRAPVLSLVDYDEDFFVWTQQTAELIEQRRFELVDVEHVAKELADMGKRDRREVRSRLIVLVCHLLKWQAQPQLRDSSSWRAMISEQRMQVELIIGDSPSLRRVAYDELPLVYRHAIRSAMADTGLSRDSFPSTCPYSGDQILDSDFFPD